MTTPPTQSGSLSGKDLVQLMRKHRVTIAALAFRIGTTQKRVREVRDSGLTDGLAVRDWIEAITGEDPGPLPEKYRISHIGEETVCSWCGCPLLCRDDAYEYVSDVFCSATCTRRSRGWN